jgi:hypothetical protein
MLKEAASVAGAALLFSPLGMPFAAHGLAGLLVGTAGLYVADTLLKDIKGAMDGSKSVPSASSGVERVYPPPQKSE